MGQRMRLFVRDNSILVRERQRDVVETFEQALLVERLDLEMRGPSEIVGHRLFFEIDREAIGLVVAGRANSGAITAWKPASSSAHTACSRELPQPKFLRATKIDAPWNRALFSEKSLFSVPSGLRRQSMNNPFPIPARTTALRNCFGII